MLRRLRSEQQALSNSRLTSYFAIVVTITKVSQVWVLEPAPLKLNVFLVFPSSSRSFYGLVLDS